MGWSKSTNFKTPPAASASSVRVVMYGDMGKAERDNASEHYVQVQIYPIDSQWQGESIDLGLFKCWDLMCKSSL